MLSLNHRTVNVRANIILHACTPPALCRAAPPSYPQRVIIIHSTDQTPTSIVCTTGTKIAALAKEGIKCDLLV